MNKPSLNPQYINSLAWYYESPRSIDVYIQASADVNAIHVRIPASKLARSLARMSKPKKSGKR